MSFFDEIREGMIERFERYVKIDTQSEEDAENVYPSTEKQKDLLKLLVQELKDLGLDDAAMDKYGYVMATYPGNLSESENAKVPVVGLLAHVDTSPEVSGKDVKPIHHKNYQGGPIPLPGDTSVILKPEDNPELPKKIGHDLITSDGTTLLGADNKAGIAEIMTLLSCLKKHPEVKHGTLRIGFTPDEEVGNGTKFFDVKKFAADFAYTIDGETLGEVENETFNAAAAVFKVKGIGVHPGYAKNKLVNAIRIIAEIIEAIKDDPAPETTEKREGYLHPYVLNGSTEEATVKMLIRDFEMSGIEEKEKQLQSIRDEIAARHPKSVIELELSRQYKNMRFKIEEKPEVIEYAMEAVRRADIEPKLHLIRGGTDGARLCYEGLLTPNIFTGGHNFHSKQEWISIQDMGKTVETLVNLLQVWVEKSL